MRDISNLASIQKNILMMLAKIRMAHTSVENEPTLLLDFIRLYYATNPTNGPTTIPIVNSDTTYIQTLTD